MTIRKKLSSLFAAAALVITPVAAQTQETASAGATTTAAPTTSSPAAPETNVVFAPGANSIPPITSTARPDLSTWFARDYRLGPDSRLASYLCGDQTRNCWTAEERVAGDVGEFRGMMVVTALSCRQLPGNQNIMDAFGAFVDRNAAMIAEDYQRVEIRLIALSATPRAGSRAHDTLDTNVNNIFSGAATMPGFCETASQILRHAASLQNPAELRALAQEVMEGSRGPAVTPPAPGA